jgi:hypothetical protein
MVLRGACAGAGYNPRRRPAPTQPGPEETKPEETEEDNLQWLPVKRSDLAFLGVLALYGEYKTNKRLGHARKARTAQETVIKSYACGVNPILCSTTEDLKNALEDAGVGENTDSVASLLQGQMEEITSEHFRDRDAYYKTFTKNVTQDRTHETNAKVMESIEQVAQTHHVDADRLRNAVESVFAKHTEGEYALRPLTAAV